jgi:hypothetical protein
MILFDYFSGQRKPRRHKPPRPPPGTPPDLSDSEAEEEQKEAEESTKGVICVFVFEHLVYLMIFTNVG